MLVCSICGVPAPANPRAAGWQVQGHGKAMCPDCLAERRFARSVKGKAPRGVAAPVVGGQRNTCVSQNTTISPACQDFGDEIAEIEWEFAQAERLGRHKVRLV